MAKYLLLKHYRGAPAPVNDVPMDQWAPDEVEAHIRYMQDFAARLERNGEFVDAQALSPDGFWVRSDGEGRPPVTDGPFAETKDLIAGWMVIDVDSYERAVELAGELSAAPGASGEPIHEWLEVRPFMTEPPTVTRVTVDDVELRGLVPHVLGVLVRRGADFATAEDAVQEALIRALTAWPRRAARRSDRMAHHGRVAIVPRPDTSETARRDREVRFDAEPPAGAIPGGDDTLRALLPVRASRPDAVLRGRADPTGGRRSHDRADRAGVPRARGDHGAAHQPGQAHGRPGRRRPSRRRAHGDAGALPRLQRGLLRRRRPRGRGDPADPAAGGVGGRAGGRRVARPDAAPPRASRAAVPDRTGASSRSPSRTAAGGTPRSSPRGSTSPRPRCARPARQYQAQAAIAALHADATRVEETDWVQIVEWYDELLRFADTPVVRLNRAVAVGEADGAPAGLAALAEIDEQVPRRDAVAAYLHEKNGDLELAARLYAEAARHAPNLAERDHQMRQAVRLNQRLQHHRERPVTHQRRRRRSRVVPVPLVRRAAS